MSMPRVLLLQSTQQQLLGTGRSSCETGRFRAGPVFGGGGGRGSVEVIYHRLTHIYQRLLSLSGGVRDIGRRFLYCVCVLCVCACARARVPAVSMLSVRFFLYLCRLGVHC